MHICGIQFWRKIIFISHEWESQNRKRIHKGTPYAFIAYTYLITGDIDTGFSYIYNAIEEDIKLKDICPTLNYPDNAPAYLTAVLSSNPNNIFMNLFVAKIRSNLEAYLGEYRNNFWKSLTIAEFDDKFLQNKTLGAIRYYFVFTCWAIFEYRQKVDTKLMQNDFSKLKNANWMFSLCLVIDKLLSNRYNTQYISKGILEFCIDTKLTTKIDFDLLGKEKIPQGTPDTVIPKLLAMDLSLNGSPIRKEIQCLLVAWNLRNFAGHNIQTQNIIVGNFEDLLRILLYDVFLVVEES